MNRIVGFDLMGEDNDTLAFGEREGVKRCVFCSNLLEKWQAPLDGVRLIVRSLEVSCTIDGLLIVNQRFKELVERHRFGGIRFIQLPSDPGFFSVLPTATVKFDAARLGTRFEGKCHQCGQYDEVIGADPIVLQGNAHISPKGFARSDLEFGSHDEKAPVVMCGIEVAEMLRTADFSGMTLTTIRE